MTPDCYAAVVCPVHGLVVMDQHEYNRQMRLPSAQWRCPNAVALMMETDPPGMCGRPAEFSDRFWEEEGGGA